MSTIVKKILVADDDKHFLQVVSRLLETAGFAVVSARNGEEALALYAAEQPDMLVLDVALPLLTGAEIAEHVGTARPILFISGRDLDRVEGFGGETRRALRKPADLDEVLFHVRALLGEPAEA